LETTVATYVIITSNHCWAKAPTLPEAEKKLRDIGGKGRGVKRVVLRFGEDTDNIEIDTISGGVYWEGPGPEILEDTRTAAVKA
jgi:hypothetical protein